MTTTHSPGSKPAILHDLPLRLPEQGVIAGVAAGIAQRYGVSTGTVRLALVGSLLFAGAGIPVYLAAWLLMRTPDQSRSLGEDLLQDGVAGDRSVTGLVLAAGALLTGVACAAPFGAGFVGMALLVGGFLLLRTREASTRGGQPYPAASFDKRPFDKQPLDEQPLA